MINQEKWVINQNYKSRKIVDKEKNIDKDKW